MALADISINGDIPHMSIARLHITLDGTEPSVTRTLLVPVTLRLDRLHLVIQTAMGWGNAHLYAFLAGSKRWARPDPGFDDDALPVGTASLADIIAASGAAPIRYIYDFGDDWVHLITVQTTDAPVSGDLYPKLVEVVGNCPPEDVGGLPGYEHFLDAIADKQHPDHSHLTKWHGTPFDPNVPETDELKLAVLKLAKKWKPARK